MTIPSENKPLYTADDLAASSPEREIGFPGEFLFTRGIQPTMYRGRLWTMRQYAGMGDAEESNRRYKFLLAQGTAGLSVAFDLPTQIGYDSDSPMRWVRSARSAWPLIPSRTWSGCLTGFRWIAFRPR